jgi:hypothetical protein
MLASLTIISALTAAVAHVPPHASSYDDKTAQRFVGKAPAPTLLTFSSI